jgi:copper chaperone NosL
MNKKLSILSRVTALICALSLIGVLVLPIWRIELSAPQYPEGLKLQIHAGKLGGDVEVVNGLNHYIGMRTLHEKDFVEFTVLPYIVGAFVLFGLLSVLFNKRWFFITWVICYLLFAVTAMVDFYHWEYNYGHNLDPTAPIRVPGMSYQPPLVGYKQLLNFGAYSIPDAGGWIFIAVGLLLFAFAIKEIRSTKKSVTGLKTGISAAALFSMVFFGSCSTGPQPIQFGRDGCDFCKMTILDQRFGGEVVTKKGKVYKFDDIHCITSFLKSNPQANAGIYLLDYSAKSTFVKANESYLLQSNELRSPMGGNVAAFKSDQNRQQFNKQLNGTILTWDDINK